MPLKSAPTLVGKPAAGGYEAAGANVRFAAASGKSVADCVLAARAGSVGASPIGVEAEIGSSGLIVGIETNGGAVISGGSVDGGDLEVEGVELLLLLLVISIVEVGCVDVAMLLLQCIMTPQVSLLLIAEIILSAEFALRRAPGLTNFANHIGAHRATSVVQQKIAVLHKKTASVRGARVLHKQSKLATSLIGGDSLRR